MKVKTVKREAKVASRGRGVKATPVSKEYLIRGRIKYEGYREL